MRSCGGMLSWIVFFNWVYIKDFQNLLNTNFGQKHNQSTTQVRHNGFKSVERRPNLQPPTSNLPILFLNAPISYSTYISTVGSFFGVSEIHVEECVQIDYSMYVARTSYVCIASLLLSRQEKSTLATGTSPTRRSDIVLNVHDMRDVPELVMFLVYPCD